MRKKKICMVSSCGGHLMELLQLLPAVQNHEFYIVTEKNKVSFNILKQFRTHYLIQQERGNLSFFFKFLYNCILSLVFLLWERPDVILTTGAGASYPTCRLGHLLKVKVVYIESFAKISETSLTGRKVYPFADHFFVQWEEMKEKYPEAVYAGTVY